ncbi:helix-turn-helix domain-containing protein [Aerosakkonemataceae cyanobacterium BLCC-F50]|uniref:Helix-turn-helix domain-containing protein n=1 Tax=Floridaenema flaviceps BLCC-F50 TaxID=3153642 RepID=A0ABV4XKE3_9CYAN
MLKQKVSLESVLLEDKDRKLISQLEQILSLEPSQVKLVSSNGREVNIPDYLFKKLRDIVRLMALGQNVSLIAQNCELTTQEAAEILHVSRPFLVKLLESGEIPYIKVGSHRRVIFQDLMNYKEQRKVKRQKGLQELTQFLQDEGFYEEEVRDIEQ